MYRVTVDAKHDTRTFSCAGDAQNAMMQARAECEDMGVTMPLPLNFESNNDHHYFDADDVQVSIKPMKPRK